MKTIWKFNLNSTIVDEISALALRSYIRMPKGAEVLCVGTQRNRGYIWVLVDPDVASTEAREFNVYVTGETIPDDPGKYYGTLQIDNGTYVYHVFEKRISDSLIKRIERLEKKMGYESPKDF